MFKMEGSFVAIPTPFKNGKVDEEGLRNIIRFQLKSRTSGLLPCGSTGEASTLLPEEYFRVISIVVEEVKGKIPVMAGTGTNSTARSVETVRKVSDLGVDALLVIVPYYNKPTQDGMIIHFKEVVKATRLPVVVYNIPGRTGVNMLASTLGRLRQESPRIVGVKEASGDLAQVGEILNIMDKDFQVMSGDDPLTLPMMSLGARGVVSVTANVAPDEVALMCSLFSQGKVKDAAGIHHRLLPLTRALFIETNPIPVKAAVSMMGLCGDEPRLPLTPMTQKGREVLRKAMKTISTV